MGRQTDRQTDLHDSDTELNGMTDRQTDLPHSGTELNGMTDRQTDRQTCTTQAMS